MPEIADAYAGCRARIGELARSLTADQAAAPVPSCPKWTVHDVVAHVAGVVSDVLAGRMDGIATGPWTQAQVDAARSRFLADIVDEWDVQAPTFEGFLDAVGARGPQAVADIATHEQDVRGALQVPGARDSDAVTIALSFLAPILVASAEAIGVRLRVEADGEAFGEENAGTVLRGGQWELMRAMTGRRSVDQLRALDWAGFDEALLPAFAFGPFTTPDDPVHE